MNSWNYGDKNEPRYKFLAHQPEFNHSLRSHTPCRKSDIDVVFRFPVKNQQGNNKVNHNHNHTFFKFVVSMGRHTDIWTYTGHSANLNRRPAAGHDALPNDLERCAVHWQPADHMWGASGKGLKT